MFFWRLRDVGQQRAGKVRYLVVLQTCMVQGVNMVRAFIFILDGCKFRYTLNCLTASVASLYRIL